MPIRKTTIQFTVVLLVGGLFGALITHFVDQRNVRLNWLGSSCLASRKLVEEIELLEKGDVSELKEDLESQLDFRIRTIDSFLADRNNEARNFAESQLKRIAAHRQKFPYSSKSPSIKEEVAAALTKAK